MSPLLSTLLGQHVANIQQEYYPFPQYQMRHHFANIKNEDGFR